MRSALRIVGISGSDYRSLYFGEKKHFRYKNICNGYKIFVTVTKIIFCNERSPHFYDQNIFVL